MHIQNLAVLVENKKILKNITLSIAPGSIHALMGPNGSGKSTLAYTLLGHPHYEVENGTILYKNQNITELAPAERAKLGIFLSFQQPVAIPGLKVNTFLKEALQATSGTTISVQEFNIKLIEYMKQLQIDPSFAYRDLNDGFSGGEKKRFELLQMLVLKPTFIILDEIDSGLDIDALKLVAYTVDLLKKENGQTTVLIITHYQRILEHISPDYVHVLYDGEIMQSGDAQLVHQLEAKGYDEYSRP